MQDIEREFGRITALAEEAKSAGLYPYLALSRRSSKRRIYIDGEELLLFANNDYLGLMDHPLVIERAVEALRTFGSSTCSSQITLSTSVHRRLEEELADFVGEDDAVLFPTCFMCNLGVITSIAGRDDVIISDRLDHASIIDGAKLSEATARFFRHNDMRQLEKLLEKSAGCSHRIIVVDGVYSMDGDLAPLPELCALCGKYDALLIVDDAHGIGVLGKNGVGTGEWFGLSDRIDIKIGTLSKALVSIGGFAAAGKNVINHLRHLSRPCVFSTVIPPASAAAALAALEIVKGEPERREKLWENVGYYRRGLNEIGFNTLESVTPIIPVLIGDGDMTLRVTAMLRKRGIFVVPIIPPAVKEGRARLRTNVMATHTREEIDRALDAFERTGRECGVI